MKLMNLNQLQQAEYCICGYGGYSLSEAMRHWKALFDTIHHFKRDVIKHTSLNELAKFMEEEWEQIVPITVTEALQESNMEKRRIMFNCIGVSRLFQELQPELIDKQVIQKTRTRWDKDNQAYQYDYADTYELYKLDSKKLFVSESTHGTTNPVYAVRCWCTTTQREYWIYVSEWAALGIDRWQAKEKATPDAIRAIAWTIRIDISDPKRIYRQGDIIIVEESETSNIVEPYHLSKQQYLELMFSET